MAFCRGQSGGRQRGKNDAYTARSVAMNLSTTSISGDFLTGIGEEMDDVAFEYSSLLEGFIAQLPAQQHVDLKFLLFRLDFSEFYTRQHMSISTMPLKFKRTSLKMQSFD
jgi:gamma-tubulin complex component 3